MKIFVTVGTTPFDSLIEYIDKNIKGHEIIYQISEGDYLPKNGEAISFVKNIKYYYHWADLVITHAGAGSIYTLLEIGKRIIVVPNFERIDKHQEDIANFVSKEKYAFKAEKFEDTNMLINKINKTKFKSYEKESFFIKQEIIKYLND